ncbi:MAG TPA: formyltransferase family protein [Candidatus Angelobacter sp.]|nr:formyltransferase family protein [Candidatus Angelobacter sp.]
MKIEFLTQEDSLYILPFFEEFLKNYAGDFEVARISCCRAMGKRSRLQLLKELKWLYGVTGLGKLFAQAGAAKILSTLPRSRASQRFYSIAQLAKAYGIPYERVDNPNLPEFTDALQQRSAELLISVACPYILKEKVLGIPPRGCINIHHAPLPRYKGMMPTFWQLYHGEPQLGVTIHYMAAKVDEGDALLQESLQVQPGESLHNLIRRSKRHGAHCMARVVRSLQSNEAVAVQMDHAQGSYFTFPKREEAREFRRRGLRVI